MKSKFLVLRYCLYILCCLNTSAILAQLTIVADNQQAIYEAGESMNFLITSTESGMATYFIRYDRYTPPLASGTIALTANETVSIPFSLNEPGMVLCWVNQNGFKATGAATFSPFDMNVIEEDPSNLLEFWEDLKTQLANEPIDPVLTFEEDGDYSTTYRINLKSIDNRRVYGYISVPDGSGPFPAVLELPPFGTVANVTTPDEATAERTGMLAMSISIHNVEPDQVDPNAYQPDIIDDEYLNYYRYAVIGAIRALDYLISRDDFDGENLAVMGVSQGGGLSMLVAGLDDRVKVMAVSNPALCQHTGYKYDKASGFPYYLRKSVNEFATQAHFDATVEATKYYDAARVVKYFDGPSLTLIGYRDTVCPPATGYAAFNQLPGPKVLVQAREVDHNHPNEYQIGRYDLFRRNFPSTLTPPWPWPDTTTGYFIDASADNNTVAVNEWLQLNGLVELNGATSGDWEVSWRQITGPGLASFSNNANNNPTVSFNLPGSYRLEFKAVDEAIAIPDKFYTAIDYLDIEVVCPTIQTSITASICEGDSLQIGNESYSVAGTYQQLYTTDLGCDSLLILDLTVNPLPVISLGDNALITTDSVLTFTLDADDYISFLWSDGSASSTFQFDGGQSGPGTFEVSVTVENEFNCFQSDTVQIIVEESISISETEKSTIQVQVNPNPATTTMYIQFINANAQFMDVALINSLGNVVRYEENLNTSGSELNLSNLASGIYFLRVKEADAVLWLSSKVMIR